MSIYWTEKRSDLKNPKIFRETGKVTLVRALDREEAPTIQVVVTVTDDIPANIVALPRTIRGE